MDEKIVKVENLQDIAEDYQREIEALKARIEPIEANIIEILGLAEALEELI